MSSEKINVTIWNENIHEQSKPKILELYPGAIHGFLADKLGSPDLNIRTATLEQPEHGLTEEVLQNTDVLVWWGHIAHNQVADEVVDRIQQHIWDGMGLLCLHSAHMSKIFRRLNGTSGKLHWREVGEKERLWVIDPSHPVTAGLPEHFELPYEEMYGEPFMIAEDAKVLMMSWFEGGEVFRSCYTIQRGRGRMVYFRPGHETFPSFHDANVLKTIANAVRWLKPTCRTPYPKTHIAESFETIAPKDFEHIKAGVIRD